MTHFLIVTTYLQIGGYLIFQFKARSTTWGERLKAILPINYLPQVVIAFKDYLREPFYNNSSYRYEAAYNLIWHCAQNMPYPDFYKVWVG